MKGSLPISRGVNVQGQFLPGGPAEYPQPGIQSSIQKCAELRDISMHIQKANREKMAFLLEGQTPDIQDGNFGKWGEVFSFIHSLRGIGKTK